jgi:hypothetical protein
MLARTPTLAVVLRVSVELRMEVSLKHLLTIY